jgi:hypothetical protein
MGTVTGWVRHWDERDRGPVADGTVRSILVVVSAPLLQLFVGSKRQEPLGVQALGLEAPVEGFDIGIVRRLAGPFPQLRLHPSPGRLVAELETELVVNPVCSLHVALLAFPAKKNVEAPIAIADTRIADLTDAGFDASLLAAAGFVVIRRDVHLQNPVSLAIDTPQSPRNPFTSSRLRAGLPTFAG